MEILTGDCIELMNAMPEKSVDVIVTSPPYFQQRDYGCERQIGREDEMGAYIETMVRWATTCLRVLKDTGSLFLNIGDKYEKKGLLMIPERLCIAMMDAGWVLRNKIVWHKPNHMPSSVKDRFCSSWEPVYFFVKNSHRYYNYDYYCNLDPLRSTPTTVSKIPFPRTVALEEYDEIVPKLAQYNASRVSKGKFANAGINKGASPGARQQDNVTYSRMRKHTLTEDQNLQVHTYLKQRAKEKGMTAKRLDEIFHYKSKAGHWLRLDHGRSLPSVDDYRQLKTHLELDDRYDAWMLEEHYVLQSVQNNPNGRTPDDLWTIPLTHEKGLEHFAVYPVELPKRILSIACPPDGVVLDPFAGSGTTGLAAKELGLRCVLIELNPEYVEVMRKRLSES
jgi:DNA modification methylase